MVSVGNNRLTRLICNDISIFGVRRPSNRTVWGSNEADVETSAFITMRFEAFLRKVPILLASECSLVSNDPVWCIINLFSLAVSIL